MKNEDPVGIDDRGHSMGNDDRGAYPSGISEKNLPATSGDAEIGLSEHRKSWPGRDGRRCEFGDE